MPLYSLYSLCLPAVSGGGGSPIQACPAQSATKEKDIPPPSFSRSLMPDRRLDIVPLATDDGPDVAHSPTYPGPSICNTDIIFQLRLLLIGRTCSINLFLTDPLYKTFGFIDVVDGKCVESQSTPLTPHG
ncbi:hypothetical protein GGS20DRAFT_541161 [Poronia punctata]|nr:hypothetical protein GGS20DRAFT_541161 [Poronia punctata]